MTIVRTPVFWLERLNLTVPFRTFGEIGYTEILVRHLTNDQPKVLGSLERLAAVRAALA